MITLLIGQFLIWTLGSAWVAVLWRLPAETAVSTSPRANSQTVVLGYGYVVGTIVLTLWMRLLSVVGISWSWLSIAIPMIVLAALALRLLPGADRRGLLRLGRISESDVAVVGSTSRVHVVLWWAFFALIAAHLLLAALEIIWRPVFPWDAWTQWATKSRVWYELSRQVPFVDVTTWFGGTGYIDAAPAYPANLPLLQVWACISVGHWDDSLMNIPSFFLAIGLAIGLYGQMRYAGRGSLLAIATAYAVVSLPFLDTHLALGGYADLPLAVYFSLSAVALWQWSAGRDRRQLLLAIALAVACPLTKNPGWAWLATLLPVLVITLVPARGLLIVAGVAAAASVVTVMLATGKADLTVMGYHVGMTYNPVWEPLWQNYYEFANWHLLWYLLPVLMLWNARRLFLPQLVAGTVVVLCGLGFLFFVFSFSSAAAWVSDYSTVNRATLHLAPVVVFYLFSLVHEAAATVGERSRSFAEKDMAAPAAT